MDYNITDFEDCDLSTQREILQRLMDDNVHYCEETEHYYDRYIIYSNYADILKSSHMEAHAIYLGYSKEYHASFIKFSALVEACASQIIKCKAVIDHIISVRKHESRQQNNIDDTRDINDMSDISDISNINSRIISHAKRRCMLT
jgi:hypothetical protein